MTYETTIPATLLRVGDRCPRWYGDAIGARVNTVTRPLGDTRPLVRFDTGETRRFYASTILHIIRTADGAITVVHDCGGSDRCSCGADGAEEADR